MPNPLRTVLDGLLDLVYPPRCAACRAPSRAGPFCATCAEAVEPVPAPCARCGEPGAAPCCAACQATPPAFESVQAGGLFGGPLADAIHAFKYEDRPALARGLGAWLAGRIALPGGAAVLSVPLGRARRIARGYDQAALLADALARRTGARRLRGALVRVRETPPQVGRARAQRAANVAGAFQASARVAGHSVVLVDDVVTTGATAGAAAAALLAAGAAAVHVVALARAE